MAELSIATVAGRVASRAAMALRASGSSDQAHWISSMESKLAKVRALKRARYGA